MRRFEVLAGLPPYDPFAVPFPASRSRAHSEGFVVRFRPANSDAWVGNFQRGGTQLDTVLEHPDGLHVVVFAGGMGYMVNPEIQKEIAQGAAEAMLSSGEVTFVAHRSDLDILLMCDGYSYAALKADGGSWVSENLKWTGGMCNASIRGDRLSGEIQYDDRWFTIEIDLNNGKHIFL